MGTTYAYHSLYNQENSCQQVMHFFSLFQVTIFQPQLRNGIDYGLTKSILMSESTRNVNLHHFGHIREEICDTIKKFMSEKK